MSITGPIDIRPSGVGGFVHVIAANVSVFEMGGVAVGKGDVGPGAVPSRKARRVTVRTGKISLVGGVAVKRHLIRADSDIAKKNKG